MVAISDLPYNLQSILPQVLNYDWKMYVKCDLLQTTNMIISARAVQIWTEIVFEILSSVDLEYDHFRQSCLNKRENDLKFKKKVRNSIIEHLIGQMITISDRPFPQIKNVQSILPKLLKYGQKTCLKFYRPQIKNIIIFTQCSKWTENLFEIFKKFPKTSLLSI